MIKLSHVRSLWRRKSLIRRKNVLMSGLMFLFVLLTSCGSGTLLTSNVIYQSVRSSMPKDPSVPKGVEIVTQYRISSNGGLSVIVSNPTSEIMIIDQTMSFFVGTDGKSHTYYDPTVRTTTTTDISSTTNGASINLGAVGSALGIGGAVGTMLNGINVGGSGTSGQSVSNTEYFTDLPKISLAPKSSGAMSKVFSIPLIGIKSLNSSTYNFVCDDYESSPYKFSVCITYSIDGGETFKKIVSDFYVNAQLNEGVTNKGHVNDALRKLLTSKTDALNEPWWLLYFNNNLPRDVNGLYDNMVQGYLYDYQ